MRVVIRLYDQKCGVDEPAENPKIKKPRVDVTHFLYSISAAATFVAVTIIVAQAIDEVRKHFTWILDPKKEEGQWDIEVHIPNKDGLAFRVKLVSTWLNSEILCISLWPNKRDQLRGREAEATGRNSYRYLTTTTGPCPGPDTHWPTSYSE